MRGRFFNWPAIGHALAYAAAAGLIAAAAWQLAHQPGTARPAGRVFILQGDPLSAVLARCQAMGEAAENDRTCLAAWAENRRRFFTYRPPSRAFLVTSSSSAPSAEDER